MTLVKLCLAVTPLQLESSPSIMLPDHQQLRQRSPKFCYTSTTLLPQAEMLCRQHQRAVNHQLNHTLLSSEGCKETSILKNIKMSGFGLFVACWSFFPPEQASYDLTLLLYADSFNEGFLGEGLPAPLGIG